MSCDLHGSWETVTGHYGGLYALSSENGPQSFLNAVSRSPCLSDFMVHLFEARNV